MVFQVADKIVGDMVVVGKYRSRGIFQPLEIVHSANMPIILEGKGADQFRRPQAMSLQSLLVTLPALHRRGGKLRLIAAQETNPLMSEIQQIVYGGSRGLAVVHADEIPIPTRHVSIHKDDWDAVFPQALDLR